MSEDVNPEWGLGPDGVSRPAEPRIVINGTTLSEAQSIAVRVAVTSMRIDLQKPKECEGLGQPLAAAYDARLYEVEVLMHAHVMRRAPKPPPPPPAPPPRAPK